MNVTCMIRIVLADDHLVVRQGVRQMLAGVPNCQVVAEAADSRELLKLLRSQPVDVLILDMSMPGRNGIELIRQIKDGWPRLAVLVFSMYPEDQYAVRAIKAGASAYLSKGCAAEELQTAVSKLAQGTLYITATVAEQLAMLVHGDNNDKLAPHQRLSDREFQIFCQLVAGKSPSEIGEALCISNKTVSTYKARILEKMQLANSAELVRYAIEHDLQDNC